MKGLDLILGRSVVKELGRMVRNNGKDLGGESSQSRIIKSSVV